MKPQRARKETGPSAPYRFLRLDEVTLQALLDGDLERASERCGATLGDFFLDHAWLWAIRLPQVRADPPSADWIARAALHRASGDVVGHLGFHQPPDEHGTIEIAYGVDPPYRLRGHARAMLIQALGELAGHPRARVVRASISPGNAASLATIAGLGFVAVGEQWDDEEGLELIFDLVLPAPPEVVPALVAPDPW